MIPLQHVHPLDPSYFPSMKQESKPRRVITARIFHEGTDQLFQDVICYVFQDEEGDWDGDGWRRIVYTTVDIKLPLYVTPDDIQTDIQNALDDEDIYFQEVEINYTLAPKESI